MVDALEQFQEQNGLKIDGYANPVGPTERAINNQILGKPRGAGLLQEPLGRIDATVGNGFKNESGDVCRIQRGLGALGYMPEDPFDRPHGLIDERTTASIKKFQSDWGLATDGWLAPGGETEAALHEAIGQLTRASLPAWTNYQQRAATAASLQFGAHLPRSNRDSADGDEVGISSVRYDPNFSNPWGRRLLDGGWAPQRGGGREINRAQMPGLSRATPRRLPTTPPAPEFKANDSGTMGGASPQPRYEYVPSPGDPLAIPLTRSIHHWGNRGKPAVRMSNAQLNKEIADKCKDVLGDDATVEIAGGPPSLDNLNTYKEYRSDKTFIDSEGKKRAKSGYALNDGTVKIRIEASPVEIWIHNDTYDAKADGTPADREQRHFGRVEQNEINRHRIHVRAPKPGEGEELDPKALIDFAKTLCEQIKKDIEAGLFGKGKAPRMIERFFDRLRRKDEPGKRE